MSIFSKMPHARLKRRVVFSLTSGLLAGCGNTETKNRIILNNFFVGFNWK